MSGNACLGDEVEEGSRAIHLDVREATGYAPVPTDPQDEDRPNKMSTGAKRAAAISVACLAAAAVGAVVLTRRGSASGDVGGLGVMRVARSADRASLAGATRLDVPLMPAATWTALGDGLRCVLSEDDTTPDAAGTARKHEGVPSIQACKDMCELWPGTCKGIDYEQDRQVCYLWTLRAASVKPASGRTCMRLDLAAAAPKVCYKTIKWDSVLKDEGKELAVLKYSNLNDCAVACRGTKECRSITICRDWRKCFLKDKLVTFNDTHNRSNNATTPGAQSGTTNDTRNGTKNDTRNDTHGSTNWMKNTGFGCESLMPVACEEAPAVSDVAKQLAAKGPLPEQPAKQNMYGDAVEATAAAQEEAKKGDSSDAKAEGGAPKDAAALRFTKQLSRQDYTWRAYSHFDVPSIADAESRHFKNITQAQAYAEEKLFDAFVWRAGNVTFKKANVSLTATNLVFLGEADPAVFFALGPPGNATWQELNATDFRPPPAEDALGEVANVSDISLLKAYAEKHGYVGFTMSGGTARMKFVGRQLAKADVVEGLNVTFYQLDYRKPPVGNVGDFYPHGLASVAGGTPDNQNCLANKYCSNPSSFCFAQSPSAASCHSTCDVSQGWSCQVLGHPRIPNSGIFCFVIAMTEDLPMLKHQFDTKQGISLCDESLILAPAAMQVTEGIWTVALPGFSLGPPGTPRAGKPSLSTIWAAWLFVSDHFYYRTKLWTVRIDPHAAFFPNEFKARMRREAVGLETLEPGYGLYLAPCEDGLGAKMTTSWQAVSSRGMIVMSVRRTRCTLPADEMKAEDEFLSECLEATEVRRYKIKGLALDRSCKSDNLSTNAINATQCDFSRSMYYPVATPDAWQACFDNAVNHHS